MIALQGMWAGDMFHVWGLPQDGVAGRASAPVGVSISHDQLRDGIGDGWDSLLASGATASELRLKLPAAALEGGAARANGELRTCSVNTLCYAPSDAIDLLTTAPRSSWRTFDVAPSFRFWSRAAWVVLELLAKQRFVPAVYRANETTTRRRPNECMR